MEHIKINNRRYYQFETITKNYPRLKYRRDQKPFIKKYNIPDDKYIRARLKNNIWIVTDGSCSRYDKLFILKNWFDTSFDYLDMPLPMPPIIELDETEQFFNDKFEPIDILVVGERKYDKCFFNVQDITNNFNMKNAYNTIVRGNSDFIKKTHYNFFENDDLDNPQFVLLKISKLFVTYAGLLKLLHTSRSGNFKAYLDWTVQTIFTAHMGTKNDKIKLASNLIGASPSSIKQVFNTFARSFPCVYLFHLGTVKSLRNSMNIPDSFSNSHLVVKWGRTDNLSKRTTQLNQSKSYGGIIGVELNLLISTHIDPQYVSQAESSIKNYFIGHDYKFEYNTFSELAIIPKNKLKTIKEQYALVGKSYEGHLSELNTQLLAEKYRADLAEKNTQFMAEKYRADLAEKEIEILQMKLVMKDK